MASTGPPNLTSSLLQLHVLERQRAHWRARGSMYRIEDGRRRDADGRLPDAAPEPARRHDDGLDLRVVLHQHHRIAIEVLLHHAAIADGALLIQHGAEPESDRALGLHGDLLGIDGVAAVDGDDQSMDLELASVAHRYLGGSCAIAGITHELRNAAIDAGCWRRVPADTVGDGIERRKVLWTIRQQLASKLQGILACGARHLVDEGLKPDRVLVRVDAAPEAHGNMGIAHGVLDEEVGDGIAEAPLRPTRVKPLKGSAISSVAVEAARRGARQDRGCCNSHVQPNEITLVIEASR